MIRREIVLETPFPTEIPLETLSISGRQRSPSDQDFGDISGQGIAANSRGPDVEDVRV